jgi:hypothetical protein
LSGSSSKIKKASFTQAIEVKDDVIENEIQNRSIDAEVNYSSIQLSLYQNTLVKKEVIANSDLAAYQLPFGRRLGNALSEGWNFFLNFLVAIAHLWVLLPVSLVIFVLYRTLNKRRLPLP